MLVPKLTSVTAAIAAAALIAVSAVPAHAVDTASAEKATNLSACVGDATEAAEFQDIDRLTAERQDAINCLAYYGITKGKTPAEYDPDSNVTRSQMALFLYRLAIVAGIDLEPTADDPVAMFGDITHLGDDRQTAIKALYSKGIMSGRDLTAMAVGVPSGDVFVPSEPINRAEMAVYLRNMVQAAAADLFDDDGDLIGVESLDEFPDARRSVPAAASEAIGMIYELGITNGQTDNTYNAAGFVERSNMALFLTRTLAHTPARPPGLTVQSEGSVVVVSLRDRAFQPVNDALVDVFTADMDDVDDAFDRDGSCDRLAVRGAPRFYHEPCEIDAGDEPTDNGDVSIDLADELTSDGLAVWAWTGRLGDMIGHEVDDDDVPMISFSPDDLPPPDASMLGVTYRGLRINPADSEPVLTARKGAEIAVRLQLRGSYTGEASYVDVPSPAGGAEYSLTVTATIPDDDDETADVVYYRSTDPVELNSDGAATFYLPVLSRDSYDVNYKLAEVSGAVSPPAAHVGMDAAGVTVKFRSGDPAPDTVLAVPLRDTLTVPAGGAATARNNVRVIVLDQYGRPIGGVEVLLQSDADGADPDVWQLAHESRTFNTGRNGVVIGYVYSGSDARVETLTAGVDNDTDGDDGYGELNCDDQASDDVCSAADVYWVTDDVAADQDTDLEVLAVDIDANTILVDTDTGTTDGDVAPGKVAYDNDDYFRVDGVGVRVAAFENALTERFAAIDDADGVDVPDRPTLTWSNYHGDDSIPDWNLTIP